MVGEGITNTEEDALLMSIMAEAETEKRVLEDDDLM